MASIVPSATAWQSVSTWLGLRNGGRTLYLAWKDRSIASDKHKLCGHTLAVTLMPRDLTRRIMSTEPIVLIGPTCSRPDVASANRTSRATARSSDSVGKPLSPSTNATCPSCITPPSASPGTSGRSITGTSNIRQYSNARFISASLRCARGASLNATAPASANSPSSAISWPARSLLRQPMT